MDENTEGAADAKPSESDDSTLTNLRADLGSAIKRRDNALTRAQAAEAKISEFEQELMELRTQLSDKGKDKARKSQDIEELESSYKQELERKQDEISHLAERLNKRVIDSEVLEVAGQHIKHPDLFLELHRGKFEIGLDAETGREFVKVKNSLQSIEDMAMEFAESKPELKRSTLKNGMGTTKTAESAEGPIGLQSLKGMSRDERVAAFKKDPSLRKAAYKNPELLKS